MSVPVPEENLYIGKSSKLRSDLTDYIPFW